MELLKFMEIYGIYFMEFTDRDQIKWILDPRSPQNCKIESLEMSSRKLRAKSRNIFTTTFDEKPLEISIS